MSAFLFLFFQAAPGCLVIPIDSPAVKSIVAKMPLSYILEKSKERTSPLLKVSFAGKSGRPLAGFIPSVRLGGVARWLVWQGFIVGADVGGHRPLFV